ncbi:MAG: phosphatidate cytidylyltransferase [Treponema sp.]|nr:phosphatidate cytidylyltransferase [Treponema sp.]
MSKNFTNEPEGLETHKEGNKVPKLVQRLIIFFIGIPVVLAIVILPYFNHLPFSALVVLFSFLAALELNNMLSHNGKTISRNLLLVLCPLLPVAAYICGLFDFNFILVDMVFILDVMIVFAYEVFLSKNFEDSNTKIANAVLVLVYCGLLPSFITRLTVLDNASIIICIFFIFVFISDSAAWLFGMTLGKNNRGLIKASPNKSIAGFIGAYLGTLLAAILIKFVFWKEIFSDVSLLKMILLSVCVTTSSIIGDLAESVFKRSSGFKDSGNIILGRGGALDSIDSILASAPFFYIFIKYMF